jgi:hypothetical protein
VYSSTAFSYKEEQGGILSRSKNRKKRKKRKRDGRKRDGRKRNWKEGRKNEQKFSILDLLQTSHSLVNKPRLYSRGKVKGTSRFT